MYDWQFFTPSFLGLLNPFALLVGVVSLAMLLTHGAAWLGSEIRGRDRGIAPGAIGTVTGLVQPWPVSPSRGCGWRWASKVSPSVNEPVANGPPTPCTPRWTRTGQLGFRAYGERPWIAIAPDAGLASAPPLAVRIAPCFRGPARACADAPRGGGGGGGGWVCRHAALVTSSASSG